MLASESLAVALWRLFAAEEGPLTRRRSTLVPIGHVAHGKSSTVRAISGVQTVRFKNELERNITIKLGYANAKVRDHTHIQDVIRSFMQIYKCKNPKCPPPSCYRSYPSNKEMNPKCERPGCDGVMELLR